MRNIFKKKLVEEEYAIDLRKNISVPDIKSYLKDEYDRAFVRENLISQLEFKIKNYEIVEQKYDAMLVVQEKTSERIKNQDRQITKYREEIENLKQLLKNQKSESINIEVNYQNNLKQLKEELSITKKENTQLKRDVTRLSKKLEV